MRRIKRLTVALLAVGLAVGGAARADGPGPPRPSGSEAPPREPRVLKRSVTPAGVVNTVVELPAEADVYLASGLPNQNFGASALYLGYNQDDGYGAERVLLRFDMLGTIPFGSVVNDARIRLYVNFSSPADDPPMGTFLRQLGSDWDESEVDWNTEPTWGPVRAENQVGSVMGWYEWQVTALVGDWVSGVVANHGVEIIGDEEVQQRERAFYSRETAGSLYPRLVVDYTDSNDTQPPVVTVDALPAFVRRDFTVSWSGTDYGGSGIASYDVQYRADGGHWADWIVDSTDTTAVFAAGQHGKLYEFRARGEDRAGNLEAFGVPEASATVDAQPPTTTVDPLPAIPTSITVTVSWTGQDDGAGIQYYDVRYRYNDGGWVLWQNQTLAVSTTFTAMNDGVYDFEARAVDDLGLEEDFTGRPEAAIIVDAQPPFIQPRVWLPLVFHDG